MRFREIWPLYLILFHMLFDKPEETHGTHHDNRRPGEQKGDAELDIGSDHVVGTLIEQGENKRAGKRDIKDKKGKRLCRRFLLNGKINKDMGNKQEDKRDNRQQQHAAEPPRVFLYLGCALEYYHSQKQAFKQAQRRVEGE
jgi:hypothetical protein